MRRRPRFEVYCHGGRFLWSWRLLTSSGQTLARSDGEGWPSPTAAWQDAYDVAERVRGEQLPGEFRQLRGVWTFVLEIEEDDMLVRFEAVKRQRTVKAKCAGCGRVRQRTLKVEYTVNPFNRGEDGTPKSYEQVGADATAELEFLATLPHRCQECDNALSWKDREKRSKERETLRAKFMAARARKAKAAQKEAPCR